MRWITVATRTSSGSSKLSLSFGSGAESAAASSVEDSFGVADSFGDSPPMIIGSGIGSGTAIESVSQTGASGESALPPEPPLGAFCEFALSTEPPLGTSGESALSPEPPLVASEVSGFPSAPAAAAKSGARLAGTGTSGVVTSAGGGTAPPDGAEPFAYAFSGDVSDGTVGDGDAGSGSNMSWLMVSSPVQSSEGPSMVSELAEVVAVSLPSSSCLDERRQRRAARRKPSSRRSRSKSSARIRPMMTMMSRP